MVGKLKKSSSGNFEYLLVAVDKFSKWIEAKPVRKADGATALKFVRDLVASSASHTASVQTMAQTSHMEI